MTTVLELLKLKQVIPFQSSKALPRNAVDPSLIMGLELETEGITVEPADNYVPGMGGTEDNSLRRGPGTFAWEYITKPATYSVLMWVLENFFNKAKFTQANYSERCSIHVHANVQDLTIPQLQSVCYLYQLFERVLYSYVGADRDKNIFCVPWHQTTMSYQMLNYMSPNGLPGLKRWQKYTGLNLIPITDKGTIEFRHMPGTCDIARISTWLQLIASLFVYGKNNTVQSIQNEIINLNTSSDYRGFLLRVFREYAHVLDNHHIHTFLEEGVIELKYALLSSGAKASRPDPLDALRMREEARIAEIEARERRQADGHALPPDEARRRFEEQAEIFRAQAQLAAARPAARRPRGAGQVNPIPGGFFGAWQQVRAEEARVDIPVADLAGWANEEAINPNPNV